MLKQVLLILALFANSIVPCSVLDYGAKCDGSNDDTKAIQYAIDRCSGKPVTFPNNSPNNICMSNYVDLHTNSELLIPKGATLRFFPKKQYQGNGKTLIYAYRQNGIQIHGGGVIDGSGQTWYNGQQYNGRPKMINLDYCNHTHIDDITLLNSPEFHLFLNGGYNATVEHVRISSPPFYEAPNTDGIDIGVDTAVVRYCHVKNGDDSIVMKEGAANVLVHDCYIEQGLGANIGTGSLHSYNITYRNIILNGTVTGMKMKFHPPQKGKISDILYENITLINVNNTIDINQFNQQVEFEDGYGYSQYGRNEPDFPKECNTIRPVQIHLDVTRKHNRDDYYDVDSYQYDGPTDVIIQNIKFKDITASGGNCGGTLFCGKVHPCHNITLENVHISEKMVAWKCSNVYGHHSNVVPPIDGCLQPE